MLRRLRSHGALIVAALSALAAGASAPAPATPPPDPQSVVVRVPAPSGTDIPTTSAEPCPVLRREDVGYELAGGDGATLRIDDWTAPVRPAVDDAPTRVTLWLKDGGDRPVAAACRYPFTLASYVTRGPTWPTSGEASLVERSTGFLGPGTPRLTLVVPLDGCFAQVELYAGDAPYQGGPDAAPSYPAPLPPDVSVATWNGDRDCVGPGVVADLTVVAVPPCPQDTLLTWVVVNPNGGAVPVTLATEGQGVAWTGTVLAVPGSTPVVVALGGAPPDALVATWVDDSGGSRSIRSASAVPLVPGVAEHAARCLSPATTDVTVTKTAVPPPGEPVAPGAVLTWTVTVSNRSDVALTAVEVVDVVPAYATVFDAGGGAVSGDRLSWLVDLPTGGQVARRYSGTVAASAPDGAVLVNTALAPLSGDSDSTSHPVGSRGAAAVTALPAPASPRPGGPLPLTGADLVAALLVAVGGLGVGSVLVLAARRRRAARVGEPQAA